MVFGSTFLYVNVVSCHVADSKFPQVSTPQKLTLQRLIFLDWERGCYFKLPFFWSVLREIIQEICAQVT